METQALIDFLDGNLKGYQKGIDTLTPLVAYLRGQVNLVDTPLEETIAEHVATISTLTEQVATLTAENEALRNVTTDSDTLENEITP